MAKRINVSLPNEDLSFCKSRDLRPSKLLQERITQIRDEQNPVLMKNLKESQDRIKTLSSKMNRMQGMVFNWGEAVREKFGEKAFDEIIEKI